MKTFGVCLTLIMMVLTMGCSEDWVTTESGLKFKDLELGEGQEAKQGMLVEVYYSGWLYEKSKRGKCFDSTGTGSPYLFTLGIGQVIKGWDEGIKGMRVGGKRELMIPSDLAYGEWGAGGVIPPKATLNFEVELIGVK
ncbi:MAG: FKBP-type peptidyl-prolyl cis-trans isomerase [bacterium]